MQCVRGGSKAAVHVRDTHACSGCSACSSGIMGTWHGARSTQPAGDASCARCSSSAAWVGHAAYDARWSR